MKITAAWLSSLLCAVCAPTALAQDPDSLLKETFADDLGGWQVIGPNAKVAVFIDSELKAPSPGALRMKYGVDKGQMSLLLRTVSGDLMKQAQSLRFWVRTDRTTTVAVVLAEEEGGRYIATAHVAANSWQKVELSIYDFALSTGPDDPKDPNGKLDLDRVTAIGLVDLAQMFAAVEMPGFSVEAGARTLFLDDFEVSKQAISSSTSSQGEDLRIDSFAHPQLAWLGIGLDSLSRTTGTPLSANGLRADYTQSSKPAILLRNLNPWVLTQSKTLRFEAASTKSCKLIVQLEESSGGKYNATIDVPADATKATPFTLSFADFKPSDDSKDDNGKLDLGQVKSLLFFDASGLLGTGSGANTLWIGNLLALAK